MTPKHIQEIKERLEKATHGPWIRNMRQIESTVIEEDQCRSVIAGKVYSYADGDFIAHARTDIEKLLKTVEIQAKALEFYANTENVFDGVHGHIGFNEEISHKRIIVADLGYKARQAQKEAMEVWCE